MKTNNTGIALALLRVAASAMLLTHGIPKLMNLLEGNTQFGDPLGVGQLPTLIVAILGEVIGPLLVIIGFKTKLATIPTIITMLVAAFVVHASDPFGTKEKALLYLLCFVVIFFAGPGKFALDKE